MNSYTAERLALARRIVARLAEREWLGAAMVAGSVAYDEADSFSDVDTLLFTTRPLTLEEMEAERREAERSGGGFYAGTPEEGFALWRVEEGIRCDLSYGQVEPTEQLIAEMIEQPSTNSTTQLIIGGFQGGIPLHNPEWIDAWQQRASNYPEALARMMVEENLRQQPCHIWRGMGAARGDRLFLNEAFLRLVDRLVGVLCGINRVWHPGKIKGLHRTVAQFSLAPPAFESRIDALFSSTLHDAVETAVHLVEEVWTLVEQQMPEVDVAGARARFGQRV